MNIENLLELAFAPNGGALTVGYRGPRTVCLFEGSGKRQRILLCLKASDENVAALEALLAHFQTQRNEQEVGEK